MHGSCPTATLAEERNAMCSTQSFLHVGSDLPGVGPLRKVHKLHGTGENKDRIGKSGNIRIKTARLSLRIGSAGGYPRARIAFSCDSTRGNAKLIVL